MNCHFIAWMEVKDERDSYEWASTLASGCRSYAGEPTHLDVWTRFAEVPGCRRTVLLHECQVSLIGELGKPCLVNVLNYIKRLDESDPHTTARHHYQTGEMIHIGYTHLLIPAQYGDGRFGGKYIAVGLEKVVL